MLLQLLQKRRSIRRFKPQPVESQKVDMLLEATLRSPSSRGRMPWEFIVIDEPSLLEGVAKAKEHGSAFVAGAPLAVVVCADPQLCDVWVEDCSIAAIILQLTAESLGLTSCWVQIRERSHDPETSAEDYLRNLLQIPSGRCVEAIIAIGYGDEVKPPHPASSLAFEKVYRNRFGERHRD